MHWSSSSPVYPFDMGGCEERLKGREWSDFRFKVEIKNNLILVILTFFYIWECQ